MQIYKPTPDLLNQILSIGKNGAPNLGFTMLSREFPSTAKLEEH